MKSKLAIALSVLAMSVFPLGSITYAQDDKETAHLKPAPIIIKFKAHSMHSNDFNVRRSKDRSIESEIKRKGIDVAYTEWMQRDHPFIFAKECVKQIGEMSKEYKSTAHMEDFDSLLTKRTDLRLSAEKYGHDVAFAEWLRKERPNVYREHFNLDKNNKPMKKRNKAETKDESKAENTAKP